MNIHLYIAIAIALIIPILGLVIWARLQLKARRNELYHQALAHLRDQRNKPPVRDLRASAPIGWDIATEPDTSAEIIFEHGTAKAPDFRDKRALEALHNAIHHQS